jgi:hypothetical protein
MHWVAYALYSAELLLVALSLVILLLILFLLLYKLVLCLFMVVVGSLVLYMVWFAILFLNRMRRVGDMNVCHPALSPGCMLSHMSFASDAVRCGVAIGSTMVVLYACFVIPNIWCACGINCDGPRGFVSASAMFAVPAMCANLTVPF